MTRPFSHWLALAALVTFWGSSFAFTKVAVETVPPIWTVCLRLWFSLLIITPLLIWRGEAMPRDWRLWGWYAFLGAIGNIIPFFLISWGSVFIDSGLAGILMSMVPLMVITMAHFMIPGENLSLFKVSGFLLGFAGVIVLIGPAALLNISHSGKTLIAQIAILGATLCYATHSITARLIPQRSTYQTTFGVLLMGALISLPIALIISPDGLAGASMQGFAMTAILGVFPTAFAGLVLFWLIGAAGPSFMSLSNYLISPFALALGIIWLGERPTYQALAALGLILCGIWISQLRQR